MNAETVGNARSLIRNAHVRSLRSYYGVTQHFDSLCNGYTAFLTVMLFLCNARLQTLRAEITALNLQAQPRADMESAFSGVKPYAFTFESTPSKSATGRAVSSSPAVGAFPYSPLAGGPPQSPAAGALLRLSPVFSPAGQSSTTRSADQSADSSVIAVRLPLKQKVCLRLGLICIQSSSIT